MSARSAVLVLLLGAPGRAAPREEAPRVSASVAASWESSDPAVEAALLLHELAPPEAVGAFWRALGTRRGSVAEVTAVAATALPELSYRAFAISLASRVRAPRVQAHRHVSQLARAALGMNSAGPCWHVACGAAHESLEGAMGATTDPECAAAAAAAAERSPSLGELPAGLELLVRAGGDERAGGAAPVTALCDPHADGFADAWDALRRAPLPSFRIIYRPALRAPSEAGAALGGFGAQLSLKSSEYETVDDRHVDGHVD